jgi:APA family basic amino acid/polyamine antiporter
MAGASLFVFRRKVPLARRPNGVFATPGYPLVPGLFVVVAVLIVGSVLWTSPVRSGIGFVILAAGVPAYLFWSRATPSPSDDA